MVPFCSRCGGDLFPRPEAPPGVSSAIHVGPIVFYTVAALAIALVGLAKGGFAGLGAMTTPLLALVMDPVAAAGMLLPILLVQDVVGIWAFRKTYDRRTLAWMLPGAALGIALGWAFAASVSSDAVRALVGVIAVVFGSYRLFNIAPARTRELPQILATFWGAVAGFTSQVAHAGGPPFQVWAMTRNFPHLVFIGTSTLFFAIVNLAKVPAFYALGQFNADNLRLTLIFLPVAIASTMAGVWLVKRIDPARFYSIINLLMVLLGIALLVQAAT
jgi:uncharacterized protein